MKPSKENFFAELKKAKSKTNLKSHKIELQSVNDLLAFTDEADRSFRSFDDDLNDWVIKYIDLQNQANMLSNQYDIWQSNTDNLENAMNEFKSKISDLGIDAESVPAYGSAERTVNAYRTNDSEYNEMLDAARNMKQL